MVENVGSDVVFCLPEFDGSGLRQRDKFPILFDDLDSNMEQLGVDSYGVSDTTLEEVVFIHVNVRFYLMAFFSGRKIFLKVANDPSEENVTPIAEPEEGTKFSKRW